MNKFTMGCGVLLAILLFIVVIAAIALGGSYNGLVRLQQTVDQSWAQVQNVYQRRADLIPNLVNTVSGAANFEKSTLTEVTNARASVGRVQLDPNKAPTDAAQLEQFQAAQGQLSNALSRLLVVVERYPELKANQNFVGLQAQLEGTENRISVERGNFNTAVQNYNIAVRSFPTNLIAGMLGLARRSSLLSPCRAKPPKSFLPSRPAISTTTPASFRRKPRCTSTSSSRNSSVKRPIKSWSRYFRKCKAIRRLRITHSVSPNPGVSAKRINETASCCSSSLRIARCLFRSATASKLRCRTLRHSTSPST